MRDIITKLEELNVEKPQLNEGLADMAHEAEKDHEVQMARSDCYKSAKYAVAIHKMLKDVSEMEGIDGWVAAKITKAADYLGSVKHYMEGQAMSDVELAVVPVAGDMTDAMTMPQESVEVIEEAEERDYICVHAKKGKYECSGTSSYAAAKKAAEHWGLKSTAGIDAHLADEEKTATESIEEVTEGRMSMRQLASMDRDAARKIEAMVGPESKYADMGDYQEALYNAARKLGLVSENTVNEDREVMVRATNIDYDGPALDKLPTDVNVKVMVNPGDGEDEIFDMVADELEDRYGVKVSGFDMKMMEDQDIEEEDVIGDIIASLNKTEERMPLPKSKPSVKIGSNPETGATRGAGDDEDYMKAAAAANMPAQQKQRMMNKAMQTNSKFSEWSKK